MPEPQNTYNRHAGPDPASTRHCGLDRHAELDSASPRHCGLDPQSPHWYAARLTASPALFLKRLAHDGIHSYRTKFAPRNRIFALHRRLRLAAHIRLLGQIILLPQC